MAMSKFSRKRVPDVVSNIVSPMGWGGGELSKNCVSHRDAFMVNRGHNLRFL